MRRTKLYLFVVVLALAHIERARAQEALADTQFIKPMMMLLVDTSGSMERRIDESGQPLDRLPTCNSNTATDQRNRWAITVEALTGSFKSYQCQSENRTGVKYTGQYDENYFIPHHNLSAAFLDQASDGILDAYKDRAKFGLMTFDGETTTSNGDTLVLYDDYLGKPAVKSAIDGQVGMYSYPANVLAAVSKTEATPVTQFGWKPLAFPGCGQPYGVNAGARSKQSGVPGALISVGRSDSATDIEIVNAQIQASLKDVRPYGGTPIAAMLDDFRYYLREDEDVKKGSDPTRSDPFYGCRKRYGLLLTDGAPDTMYRDTRFQCTKSSDPTCPMIDGERRCQCPYDEPQNIASTLVTSDGLEKLFVVAFNVDNAALNQLNLISQAGKSGDALAVNTPLELTGALASIMNLSQPESTSRSVPVVINTGRPVTLKGAQYVITAGFQVGKTEDAPWEGRLFRQRVECNGAVAATQDLTDASGDLFHLTLNRRDPADRVIKTVALSSVSSRNGSVYAGTALSPIATTSNLLKALINGSFNALTLVESALVELGLLSSLTLSEYNVALTDFNKLISPLNFGATTTTTERDKIVDYVRGVPSNRANAKLADIYHSNPAVLAPLMIGSDQLNTFDPALRTYYLNLAKKSDSSRYGDAGRPGAVFVGTNDGVLHAFNLDTWTDKSGNVRGPGYEFWGFVPPSLFDNMSSTATPSHNIMFDGSPVVKDVILSRTSSSTQVATVLVSAVRGAASYIALDVTYPESPAFLWQRSFKLLGNTVATPAVTQVKVKWSGVEQTRAVAILPGGAGKAMGAATATCDVDTYERGAIPHGGRTKVRCWEAKGRSLYVVDIATGTLIQEFDYRHFSSPMTGSVAVDGEELGLSRAAYMSDDDGVLWRLSMMNSDPSKWRVAPIWDVFSGNATSWDDSSTAVVGTAGLAGRVASNAPVLVRDPKTANLTILVGTGDVDNLLDDRPNRVVSLQEVRSFDAATGELLETNNVTMKLNWGLQLDAYESVTGPISVLDEVAYFTTFKGPSDKSRCLVGGSRIVGAHVRDKASSSQLPLGSLMPESGTTKVLWYSPTGASTALLLGLNVSPDPMCVAGSATNDPLASGALLRVDNITALSRGKYQLRTMVAGQGGDIIGGSNTGGSTGQRAVTRSIPAPNVARAVGWASSIE